MLRHLIVKEDWVLEPHVKVFEDSLLYLPNIGRSLDQLGCQPLLRVQLFILPRLEKIRVVFIVEELFDAEKQGCQLKLRLVAQVLVLPLGVGHFLWIFGEPLELAEFEYTFGVVLSKRVELLRDCEKLTGNLRDENVELRVDEDCWVVVVIPKDDLDDSLLFLKFHAMQQ